MPAPHPIAKTLVAGYDGPAGAAAAVRWAAGRIAPDGRLIVVCAEDPGTPAPLRHASEERARAGLEALWMEEDVLVDREVELVVAHGAPVDALCRAADHVDADGIVVGRHHAGPFSSDTVRQLLAVTHRPVTVVPDDRP